MTKFKLIRQRNIILGILCFVAVVGVGLIARAYISETPPTTVIENAGGVTINNPAPVVDQVIEEGLGSMTSPDIVSRYLSVNGDTTFHITGEFKDATTTIIAFKDPFETATSSASDVVISGTYPYGRTGATSTVDLVRLDITGAATSTYSVSCGASAGQYTADTVSLLDTAANGIATSSVGMLENNLTAALGGIADAGTVEKITLTPTYPWFVCTVTSVYPGAFTEATNTFDGKFTVQVHKQR